MSGFDNVFRAVQLRNAEMGKYVYDAMNDYADEALSAITALRAAGIDLSDAGPVPMWIDPPQAPLADLAMAELPDAAELPAISDPSAGLAIGSEVTDSVASLLAAAVAPVVPVPTAPAAPSISLPDAPALATIADPGDAPTFADVSVPAAPALATPGIPDLDEITVPAFVFPVLPDFDASAPEFVPPSEYQIGEDAQGNTTITRDGQVLYRGGKYDLAGKALFGAVYQHLQSIISVRGTGIAPAVEQAMFDAARAREDEITRAAVQAAQTDWAARGFALPGGVLDAKVQQIRDEQSLKSRSLSRDVLLKRADQELQMLQFAMSQAMAAEQFQFEVFQGTARLQLDTLQAALAANAQVVQSAVTVFNARAQLVQLEADIWRTKVEGELKKLDVLRAELEAAKLRGELNQQKVQTYVAMYEGVKAEVQLYTAKLSGVQAQLQVQTGQIEAYRARVQAYAERQAAERSKMQTFTDRVNAERAKVEIYDAQAKVYLGQLDGALRAGEFTLQKAKTAADAKQGDIAAMEARLRAATAKMQAEVSALEAANRQYLAELDATSKGNEQELGRYRAELDARVQALRSAVDTFQAKTQAYATNVNALGEAAKVSTMAAQAAGELGAKVAQGALAAINVSASMGVSASTVDDA